MKIDNDKYYTPIEIANHCWEKVDEIIGLDNITEIIEPSVGGGSFYHYHRKPDIGYDILPECDYKGVIKGNYLSQWLEYKKGRLVIGNPPYGDKNALTIIIFRILSIYFYPIIFGSWFIIKSIYRSFVYIKTTM